MIVAPGEWVQRLSVDNALSGIRRVSFRDVAPLMQGRYVHLAGVFVRAEIPYTATEEQMPAALPGELIPSVLTDFRLRVGAHEYLRGTMDGADVLHCARQRLDRAWTYPADVPKADSTGGSSTTIEIYLPTSRPAAPQSMRYDYTIPVAALAECGESELTFSSATSARGFAGVVFDAAATSLSVHAHLVALDDIRETVWHWERFSSDPQKLTVSGGRGGVEALMWRTVSASGDPDVTDATDVLLTVDGQSVGRAESASDIAASAGIIRSAYAPLQYGASSFDGIDIVTAPASASRTKYPRGQLQVTWGTRQGAERFIGMFTGDRTGPAPEAIRSALGARGRVVVVPAYSKKPTLRDSMLDGKVYWPGMPGVAARKPVARLGRRRARGRG